MDKKYLIGIYDAIVVMVIAIISIIVAYILMKEDPATIIVFQGLLMWLLTTLSQFFKEWKEKKDNFKEEINNEKINSNGYTNPSDKSENYRLIHCFNPLLR